MRPATFRFQSPILSGCRARKWYCAATEFPLAKRSGTKSLDVLPLLGREGEDCDHSNGDGDLKLPTLGLSVPLYPGDILIFFASLLPHQVKLLPEEERHKRTVATLFTCAPTQMHLQDEVEKKRKRLEEEEPVGLCRHAVTSNSHTLLSPCPPQRDST